MTLNTQQGAVTDRATHTAFPVEQPQGTRDLRLDFFRGLCLVMIYINHIPGTIYENFTSRNFGLSDAAEGFVFMSGCAAALAYGPKMAAGLNLASIRKAWGRSWQLYVTYLATVTAATSIIASGALWFGGMALLVRNGYQPMLDQPLAFFIGLTTLGFQPGYVNILPMYAVLMLAAPFLIRLGQRNPTGLLGFSLCFWVLVGSMRLNLPNFPIPGGWFFNPLAWQVIFSLGILTGLALRKGERFVPVNRWMVAIALIWVVFCGFWAQVQTLREFLGHQIWQLRQMGAPFILVEFDKTFVCGPRFLHFIALAYLMSLPGLIPRIAASRVMAPVRLMGKHGLLVFSVGTVVAIFGQTLKEVHPGGFIQDSVLVLGGLVFLWALAYLSESIRNSNGTPPSGRKTSPRASTVAMPLAYAR